MRTGRTGPIIVPTKFEITNWFDSTWPWPYVGLSEIPTLTPNKVVILIVYVNTPELLILITFDKYLLL